ncbi:MAG: hypothetical protein C5B59_07185 [Bacteroidetes bacterium]|nr:MAG: hypothetical protein C5B59_07185 [Bacteroidota bacterium]
MIELTTMIKQFDEHGEKTGWTFIIIPSDLAQKLKPGNKKSFRVKGTLDALPVKGMAILPMGGGEFILPLNAGIRKSIHKGKGAMLRVVLQEDKAPQKISSELLECLSDEPKALEFFNSLAPSHKLYFSKWIEGSKTEITRTRRIGQTVNALSKSMNFGQMLRKIKQEKDELGE